MRFSPAAISKPVASVAPCVSQPLHKLHSPCWATEHSCTAVETRCVAFAPWLLCLSLDVAGRRNHNGDWIGIDWVQMDLNGSKFSKCCVPIPCLSHAYPMPSLLTLLGHPLDTLCAHISVFVFRIVFPPGNGHKSLDTRPWQRQAVDLRSMCYAVLRRPAKFETEPTHLRKWRRSRTAMWCCKDPTSKSNRKQSSSVTKSKSWGSSHSCRHPGSPKCPGECPGMNAPMVGNVVKVEPPLHASYAH